MLKTCVALLALLLSAAPALAQSRVYTNANLGVPLVATRPDPSTAAAILAPNQVVFTAPIPFGPQVVGVWSSPTAGPYGEFPKYYPRTLYGGVDTYWPITYPTNFGQLSGWPGVRGIRSFSVRPLLAPHPVFAPPTLITVPARTGLRRHLRD